MTSIFENANRPARDRASSWYKFETVGDRIGGIVRDMFEKPATAGFPSQRCFTLETEDGELVNVGLKKTDYILSRTDALQVGDELGIEFEKEIPAKQAGFNPAKSMALFVKLNGERGGLAAKDVVSAKEEGKDGEELDF